MMKEKTGIDMIKKMCDLIFSSSSCRLKHTYIILHHPTLSLSVVLEKLVFSSPTPTSPTQLNLLNFRYEWIPIPIPIPIPVHMLKLFSRFIIGYLVKLCRGKNQPLWFMAKCWGVSWFQFWGLFNICIFYFLML